MNTIASLLLHFLNFFVEFLIQIDAPLSGVPQPKAYIFCWRIFPNHIAAIVFAIASRGIDHQPIRQGFEQHGLASKRIKRNLLNVLRNQLLP